MAPPSPPPSPPSHLVLPAEQIHSILYDNEHGPFGGERKIVETAIGKFIYVKRHCMWDLDSFTPSTV
jgi:hypothetical protein